MGDHSSSAVYLKATFGGSSEYGMGATGGDNGPSGRVSRMVEKNRDGDLVSRRGIRGFLNSAEDFAPSWSKEPDGSVTLMLGNYHGTDVSKSGIRLDAKAMAYLEERLGPPTNANDRDPQRASDIAANNKDKREVAALPEHTLKDALKIAASATGNGPSIPQGSQNRNTSAYRG